jgi:hypothetical protein
VFTTAAGTMPDQHDIHREFRQITRAAGPGRAGAEISSSVLSMLQSDPKIVSKVARYESRRRVMAAVMMLSSATSPQQIRETVEGCPEVVTEGAATARELLDDLGWPSEASRFAQAQLTLIRSLAHSIDADLREIYETFAREREAACPDDVAVGRIVGCGAARFDLDNDVVLVVIGVDVIGTFSPPVAAEQDQAPDTVGVAPAGFDGVTEPLEA